MTDLPVREMVLYKHGVGFFVRQGAVSGASVALAFRQDEINDVLKSLAVFDQSGGQVLGIHYQTPMDKAARLANSSINLSIQYSLTDLVRDLRGRQVALTFEITPGTLESITGRVIGVEQPNAELLRPVFDSGSYDTVPGAALLSVLADDAKVRVFQFGALRAISILDEQSGHDLTYFLDTSMGEDTRRTVTLRLSEGAHELVVYYVAPSPTWRVSYRLVAESEESSETGKALLQGWGLFDNRLEEDLEDVRVTLVAGQPISFIYELYASRIPVRPTVQDESRVAPGPVEYAASVTAMHDFGYEDDALPDESFAARPKAKRAVIAGMGHGIVPSAMEREAIAQSTAAQAQTRESGEFFQYEVTTPVSVKRGESALVPIIGSEVSYQRELLYNGSKLPNHPVAAFRFDNSTGLTLERGPVTVVEDGDYKGEAVIPFTKDRNLVYVPYAVELGVRMVELEDSIVEVAGLSFKEAYIVYDEYVIDIVTYKIENATSTPLVITIEADRPRRDYELYDTPQPAVESASEWRWRVSVGGHGANQFTYKMRFRMQRKEELRRLDHKKLQRFMQNRWLDQSTLDALSEMLDNLGRIQRAQAQQKEFDAERNTIYAQQEQIRANLAALQPTGQEAALRNRVLAQLEAAQNRLEDIARQHGELTQQIAEADRRGNEIIEGLG